MPRSPRHDLACWLAPVVLVVLAAASPAAAQPRGADGVLRVQVVDAQSGKPLAARMVLRNSRGRAVTRRGMGVSPLGDHFYVDGQAALGLRRGQYTFELTTGPEYKPHSGHFEIQRRADDSQTLRMNRVANLEREAWLGADLEATSAGRPLTPVLRAEQLTYAPLVAHRADGGRWEPTRDAQEEAPTAEGAVAFGPHAALVENDEGAILFFSTRGPLSDQDLEGLDDLSAETLLAARERGLRVVAADLTSWRLPMWLAAGALDAAVVIDSSDTSHSTRGDAWGRPRDESRYANARGAARWREAIYFHMLSAGVRVPPAAGSGSGFNERALGACRVYAFVPEGFSQEAWWDALAAGETFVTNGPLLRPTEPPGRVYRLPSDAATVSFGLSLTTGAPIEYLDVVTNGQVARAIPLRELVESRGQMPPIDCRGAGWFVLRAVANTTDGYVRAMTAPYYFQPQGGEPRVSRASCEFFLEWLDAYAAQADDDAGVEAARRFWRSRAQDASAP